MTTVSVAKPKLTIDHAARRFVQMRDLEAANLAGEIAIGHVLSDIHDLKTKLKDLRKQQEARFLELRGYARDEGELPLFPFDEGED